MDVGSLLLTLAPMSLGVVAMVYALRVVRVMTAKREMHDLRTDVSIVPGHSFPHPPAPGARDRNLGLSAVEKGQLFDRTEPGNWPTVGETLAETGRVVSSAEQATERHKPRSTAAARGLARSSTTLNPKEAEVLRSLTRSSAIMRAEGNEDPVASHLHDLRELILERHLGSGRQSAILADVRKLSEGDRRALLALLAADPSLSYAEISKLTRALSSSK